MFPWRWIASGLTEELPSRTFESGPVVYHLYYRECEQSVMKARAGALNAAFHLATCLTASVVASSLVEAQGPEPWFVVAAVQDTLASLESVEAVSRYRKQGSVSAFVVASEALGHVVDGLADLRLAQLGEGRRATAARKSFEKAHQDAPAWAYPLYGVGLARLAEAHWKLAQPLNIGTRVGVGDRVRAFEAFTEAAGHSPEFTVALAKAVETALLLRTPEIMDSALSLSRRAERSWWRDPGLWLLLGRLEMRVGDPDSAVASFGNYLSSGGDRGIGLLELARARLARGDTAYAEYFEGAELAGPAALHGYRRDLQYIATPSELARFDSVAGGRKRREFLERFWRRRDALDLRDQGERLREHYRRLAFARRHFWLDATRRHYWSDNRFVSEQLEFDDRGIVYLRHGEPDLRLIPFVYGSTGNESWRYQRPEGTWLLHFCAQGSLRDYRLIESAFDIVSSRCNTGPVDPAMVLESRYSLDPLYNKLAGWGANGRRRLALEEREIGRNSLDMGVSSDSHLLRFGSGVSSEHLPLLLGGPRRGALLQLPFALLPEKEATADWQTARVRLSVMGIDSTPVATVDTVVALSVSSDGTDRRRFGRVSLQLRPGTWHYRVAFSVASDSIGVVLPVAELPVKNLAGHLDLSDIVLGSSTVPSTWRTASGEAVHASPGANLLLRQPVELYYEVYGAGRGIFDVSMEVMERKGGGLFGLFKGTPRSMEFSFQGEGAGAVTPVHQSLDLSSLPAGDYRLTIKVVLNSGAELYQQRDFVLRD